MTENKAKRDEKMKNDRRRRGSLENRISRVNRAIFQTAFQLETNWRIFEKISGINNSLYQHIDSKGNRHVSPKNQQFSTISLNMFSFNVYMLFILIHY